jgi:hypothetical protein
VIDLKGGVKHTFTNTGTVAATIVEVFGKLPAGRRPPVARPLPSRDFRTASLPPLHASVQLDAAAR